MPGTLLIANPAVSRRDSYGEGCGQVALGEGPQEKGLIQTSGTTFPVLLSPENHGTHKQQGWLHSTKLYSTSLIIKYNGKKNTDIDIYTYN